LLADASTAQPIVSTGCFDTLKAICDGVPHTQVSPLAL